MMTRVWRAIVTLLCVFLALSVARFVDYSDEDIDRPYKRDFWGNSLRMMESSRSPCASRRCYRYQDCCHGFTCTRYESHEYLNSFSRGPTGRCKRIYDSNYFHFQ